MTVCQGGFRLNARKALWERRAHTMKTNTKMKRKSIKLLGKGRRLEPCKLERLKKTGAYAWASQAEGWSKGIEAVQADIGCAVLRRPASKRKLPIQTEASGS